MTIERCVVVAAPLDDERALLIADIHSARSRAEDAEPGDRLDIVRYEGLSSQLEAWAFSQIGSDDVVMIELDSVPAGQTALYVAGEAPGWLPEAARDSASALLSNGSALVLVALPLEFGQPSSAPPVAKAPPPATPWKSVRNARGAKAVEERFRDQLKRATTGNGPTEPISPTGIQNRILTEALRSYVDQPTGSTRVDVSVLYRDGSRAANSFPLRSIRLARKTPRKPELDLSFALLSIRHTELDPIVDGAWLRNAQISQLRAQAQTDDLVYDISCKQLDVLTRHGTRSVLLRMYQTGLEPAIVGFYRAAAAHLLEHPGTLTVIPMYFQQRQHQPAHRRHRNNGRPDPVVAATPEGDTNYSEGAPWTTG